MTLVVDFTKTYNTQLVKSSYTFCRATEAHWTNIALINIECILIASKYTESI